MTRKTVRNRKANLPNEAGVTAAKIRVLNKKLTDDWFMKSLHLCHVDLGLINCGTSGGGILLASGLNLGPIAGAFGLLIFG